MGLVVIVAVYFVYRRYKNNKIKKNTVFEDMPEIFVIDNTDESIDDYEIIVEINNELLVAPVRPSSTRSSFSLRPPKLKPR